MTQLGVKTAIFSVTAPGACILDGQPSYDLARRMNEYSASLRDAQPCKFGFFANLPNLLDTEATLNEIAYALDTLKADGVVLFTRYGDNNTYLGHPDLDPIWAELDRRRAVVFVHPTHPVDLNKVNPRLLQPLIDYPLETTRTAMDMITSGTRAKYSNCTIILSHAGGALPYLISRVIDPLKRTPDATAQANLGTTASQGWKDFQSFHYDLALSASPQVLNMALEIIPHDHLLYGVSLSHRSRGAHMLTYPLQSDFPYASAAAYPQFLEQLENFNMTAELRAKINYENGKALFPRLAKADGDCMPTTVDVVAKSC